MLFKKNVKLCQIHIFRNVNDKSNLKFDKLSIYQPGFGNFFLPYFKKALDFLLKT
jgi:hypothetical protein